MTAGKEWIVTKQRSSWRKVFCAPLVECKWIVAVFLGLLSRNNVLNYLFEEVTIRVNKGQ